MIKFFRHIRQKLLSESKFSKYLLYAIGEIILVVIGILIALQINNWNEDREELSYQNLVLDEINRALLADIKRYRENLDILRKVDSGITGVVNFIEKPPKKRNMRDFHESANKTILDIRFEYNAGAYEGLRAAGLEKIRNTQLRSKIISYYEITLTTAQEEINEGVTFFEERQREIRETLKEEGVFRSEFVQHKDSLVSIRLNIIPERMLKHDLYPEFLQNIMWEGAGHRSQLNHLIVEAETLIKEIEKELEHIKP